LNIAHIFEVNISVASNEIEFPLIREVSLINEIPSGEKTNIAKRERETYKFLKFWEGSERKLRGFLKK